MKLDRMNGMKRTDYCGELTKEKVGSETVVAGWVQRQRDLGGLIFVTIPQTLIFLKRLRRCAANLSLWQRERCVCVPRSIPRYRQAKSK